MEPATGILIVLCCLALESFFSGSEIALVSADRAHLEARAAEGHGGAALALDLLAQEDRLLGTCLIGTNLCTITGTTVVSLSLATRGITAEWAVALVFIPFTLILGEALPKTVYQFHANAIAPALARPLSIAQQIFTPLLWVVSLWANALTRLTGGEPRSHVTRRDIMTMLDREPGIDPEEQRMIRGVFEITETSAEDCMTPLVDVAAIRDDAPISEAVEVAVRSGHSRIPVYGERIDNIVGVLQHQDLLFGTDKVETVRELMQPVRFVPESKRADELLHEMRRNREHFVVVVDEYGGSVGIVTIEDIVEQIVGDIRDERDADEPSVRRIADNQWRVPARTEIDELEELIGRAVPEGEYETVAGLILHTIGRIPAIGEILIIDGMSFRVEEGTDRSIVTVLLTIEPE